MDDILIWGASKSEIWFYYCQLNTFLEAKLKQKFKLPIFNKTQYSYNFLGYILKNKNIQPNNRNQNKYIKKLNFIANELDKNNISEAKASSLFWCLKNHQNFKINSYV